MTEVVEKPGAWEQSARPSFRFILLGVGILAALWLTSNVRTIEPDSQAVVFRLGEAHREQGPGLLLAWPRPFEDVAVVPSRESQVYLRVQQYEQTAVLSSSYTSSDIDGSLVSNSLMFGGYVINRDPRANGSFLVTGDFSIIHLESILIYQITNPARYVLAQELLQPALTRIYNSSAVAVTAARELDTILVARPERAAQEAAALGRERLRSDLVAAMNLRLKDLADQGADLGVMIARIDLGPTIPNGAKSAFDYVLVAAQQAEAAVARARTDGELATQSAIQEADRIRLQAEAGGQERIDAANRRTAAVASLAAQRDAPMTAVLRRLYVERIKPILAKAGQVDAVDRTGAGRLILPGETAP